MKHRGKIHLDRTLLTINAIPKTVVFLDKYDASVMVTLVDVVSILSNHFPHVLKKKLRKYHTCQLKLMKEKKTQDFFIDKSSLFRREIHRNGNRLIMEIFNEQILTF